MILFDLHCHTSYCDGKNTPEEMIHAAIEKGLGAIGFSGHGYTSFDESYCMSRQNMESYKCEIAELREKYKGKIDIYIGVEADVLSDTDFDGFDYKIGSAHYIKAGDRYLPIDESSEVLEKICKDFFSGDYYALADKYFQTVSLLACKKPDIIGHLDLITKFNERGRLFDTGDERYLSSACSAVDALIPLGVPFEINTGAISRGYRSVPYPEPLLISYIKSKGGKLILSSDSHSADNLAFGFEEWKHLME
ncbi:MAG: histidinol-phosphatase [Clostridia bacterium]|nr:histidinol-phosphatase [Clostridia bacterium]